MSIAVTFTTETYLLMVNKRTNYTKTFTIYNINTGERFFQRPETNSAGTAIATVIRMDGGKTSYRTV